MSAPGPQPRRHAVFRFDARVLLSALAGVGADLALVRGGQSGAPMIGLIDEREGDAGLAMPVFSLAVARAPADTPEGRVFQALTRTLADHREEPVDPAALLPLLPSILTLVMECGRGEEALAPRPHEHLLVFPEGASPRAQRALKELTLFATRVRAAEIGTVRDRALALLVHDDERLGSAYGALVDAGRLAGGVSLVAHAVGTRNPTLVYLPAAARPTLESLGHLLDMVRAAPNLFGADAAALDGRLLAVAPTPRDGDGDRRELTVFPLTGARFLEAGDLLASPPPAPRAVVRRLQPPEDALASLERVIAEGSVRHGYRLRLRPGFRAADVDREIDRLREQIRQAEERLAYLSTLERGRATLWRFPQRHLPLLLRAVALLARDGVRGRALYGFETGDLESGWHYLLFEDPSTAHQLAPLLEMQSDTAEDGPRAYWLDPPWADAHDADIDHDHLVFVPEGFSLSPTLPADPEAPVARILERLARKLGAGEELPARPIYLFDPDATGPEERISLHVLDRAAFAPPELSLGWLDDHLRLVERATADRARLEPFFEQLAEGLERAALAERLAGERAAAERRLATLTDEVRDEVSRAERALAEELAERERALARRAEEEETRLAERLAELTALAGRGAELAERESEAIAPAVAQGRAGLESASRRLADLRDETERALRTVGGARRELERLERELRQLEGERERAREGREP